MITFMESKENSKESDKKHLDSQLWHACAGGMVQMPPLNSKVLYFPQGHLEHASDNIDFSNFPRIPSYIPCRLSAIEFLADPETDEVFARIRLAPITKNDAGFEDEIGDRINGSDQNREKPASFAKTLTQSDANNGGGFSVPRYCAETIFPRLDYSADPPVQTILAKDVHGDIWKFRHIYRGTPRRHLLTTGWSNFVSQKKLVAGDSIVFLRAENGDLCVGIRRAKRGGLFGGCETGWNPVGGGNCVFSRGGYKCGSKGGVKSEDVVEAARLGASGKPFDVVYYPRAGMPEFFVKANLVEEAMRVRWCSGMRFKMAFETEDSSRISWFMGTVSSVQVADPVRWADSPWRLLQVRWDEPDLLQNVKRVNPWLVEVVSNVPPIHISHFSPPIKKPRLLQQQQHHHHLLPNGQIQFPSFSYNLLGCLPHSAPARIQGARHVHLSKMHPSFFPLGFLEAPVPVTAPTKGNNNISCLLTMGTNLHQEPKNEDNGKSETAPFLLFGQPILTEKQMSLSGSSDTVSDCDTEKVGNNSDGFESDPVIDTGHCKVFVESEDVGRSFDLSMLSSYQELYEKLTNMFGIEISDISNRIMYRDGSGLVRQIGEESFSNFIKTARRLTVAAAADSSSENVGV